MKKKPITLRIDPLLLSGVDMYREQQEVAPDKTAVVEAAIRKFLEDHGISMNAAERQNLRHAS